MNVQKEGLGERDMAFTPTQSVCTWVQRPRCGRAIGLANPRSESNGVPALGAIQTSTIGSVFAG